MSAMTTALLLVLVTFVAYIRCKVLPIRARARPSSVFVAADRYAALSS
jgi:hypothetical protein